MAKANDKALEMETKGKASAKEVKESLKPVEEVPVYFKQVADTYLEEQKALGNYEVYKTDRGRLKRFYEFAKNGEITFPEITVNLLNRYLVTLKLAKKFSYDETKPAKPLSERTIVNHLIIIRTIYNRALTAKLAKQDDYPFGADGKIAIKQPESSKIGLEEAEIQKIETLDLSEMSTIYNDAQNIWLMEFYFAGMRVTDDG